MRLFLILNLFRLFPIIISSKKINKNVLVADFSMYTTKKFKMFSFLYMFFYFKPYRSVYYERIKKFRFSYRICKFFLPPLKSIEFKVDGEMGPGVWIVHNCCVIHASEIGSNVRIGPFVTIGKKDDKRPIIGDNVTLNANSVTFGNVKLQNCIVGAGAVVNKSFENVIVAGNPAKIIKNI